MNNYTGAKQRKRWAAAPPFSVVKVSVAGTVLAKRARPLLLVVAAVLFALWHVTKPRYITVSVEDLRKAGL